ncbi:MAG: hypothetical protein HFI70_01650 [Lachnospiraceae bacterium]|nr:hypothetical protein [Lachnospiraceae bacterium]
MRRYIQSFTVIMGMAFLVLFAAGPREERDSYTEMVEGHNAFKLFKDGVWEIRYISHMVEYTDRIKSTTVRLSVNMNRELSEEEMLGIMDYYELTRNCKFVGNEYVGERETDFTCFAVFFRGDTDEEVRRIKYLNGKEVQAADEEENNFPHPEVSTSAEDLGEWP